MKRLIGFLFSLLGATAAWAQGTIEQSGPVIPFHFTAWYQNGVVGDAGSPSSPFASALGLFDGAQCPFGISSQTGPGPSLAQSALFTICQTNTATTFVLQGLNGLPSPNFFFQIGGITYPFPGLGNGDVTGPLSSTGGNFVCFNGTTGVLIADCGLSPSAVAVLASPHFTGIPTAPTAVNGTNTTQLATTAFVQNAITVAPGYVTVTLFTGTGNVTATTAPQKIMVAKIVPAITTVVLPAASNWPNCPSIPASCPTYTIKDFGANSSTYPITVSAADSAQFVASSSASSFTIQSNGAENGFTLVGTSWSVN